MSKRTKQLTFEEEYDLHLYRNRLATYKQWPFGDESSISAAKMAAAGFYHSPSCEPDGVKCYVCQKELDCWDEDDDAWKEHVKHSSHCAFLKITDPLHPTLGDVIKLEGARQILNMTSKLKEQIAEVKKRNQEVQQFCQLKKL